MKKIRKVLSAVLSILLVMSCFAMCVAAEGECSHDYAKKKVEATCYSIGYVLYDCRNCDDSYRTNEVPATGNHTWKKISETKPLACTEAKICTYKCINNGCSVTKTEPAKDTEGNIVFGPHDVIKIEGKDATCTLPGYTPYTRCLICGEIKDSQPIPATGHSDIDRNGNCDVCNYLVNPEIGKCDCYCHCRTSFESFIYSISSFFWKLFKINKECQCGVIHW